MTPSSSSSSRSTWLIPPGPGWIIYQETSSIAGRISEGSSPANCRAHTCVMATPGIRRAADKSHMNRSEITSDVSHKSAMSFLVWPTPTSSRHSGMARYAAPWFMSLATNNQKLPRSCSTSQLDTPLARRWLGLLSS
jgi:hypothetical protein